MGATASFLASLTAETAVAAAPYAAAAAVGAKLAGGSQPKVGSPQRIPEKQTATATTDSKRKQREQVLAAAGRGGTVKTGPLGLLNEPNTAIKTLLGT